MLKFLEGGRTIVLSGIFKPALRKLDQELLPGALSQPTRPVRTDDDVKASQETSRAL